MRWKPLVFALAVVGGAACREKARDVPAPAHEPKRSTGEGQPGAPPAAHKDESEEHEELPTKVRLAPKVVEKAGIKTAAATAESLPAYVDLTGEISTDPDTSARLAARVSGRIVEVRVKEGDRVRAGDVIAILESPELARARAALTSTSAHAQSARLNAQRLKSLESSSLASGQEVAAAEAEAAGLEAEVAAARQTLTALTPIASQQGGRARLIIRAPLAGFILARDGVPGQTVDGEHVIAVIGALEHAYFLGRLFEKDLARINAGATAEVRLNAYPAEVFDGRVEAIGKQLDPAARTVTARIVVRNHGDLLKVGLFGTARVISGPAPTQRKRVVVPLSAVTRIADKDVVFVSHGDGDFEVHHVTLGNSAASRVEVLTGLREGERIVVEGIFTLKSAVLKGTFAEEGE
jgi:cobalt-zinc-cadmium efflux system membrane fusion protein